MYDERPWDHPSLEWIHRAREQHVREEQEKGPAQSPEAKALADRLNLPKIDRGHRRFRKG